MQHATHTCQAAELKQSLAALVGVANARDIILEVRSGSTIVSVKFATAVDPSALASAAQACTLASAALALASPELADARVAQAARDSALTDSHGCRSDYSFCAAGRSARRWARAGGVVQALRAGAVRPLRGWSLTDVASKSDGVSPHESRRVASRPPSSLGVTRAHTRIKHARHASPTQLASASAQATRTL